MLERKTNTNVVRSKYVLIKISKFCLIGFNASVFCLYGLMKIIGWQLDFQINSEKYYNTMVKNLEPVNFMWLFHSVSVPYAKSIGAAQLLAAALICIPFTRKIGLLFYLFLISQIVLINFCFDITIVTKYLSVLLLLNTCFLIYLYRSSYKFLFVSSQN